MVVPSPWFTKILPVIMLVIKKESKFAQSEEIMGYPLCILMAFDRVPWWSIDSRK